MEQKTKLSVLAILLVVIIAGSVYFILNKKNAVVTQTATPQVPSSDQKLPDAADTNTDSEAIREISGKVISIAEKAVYIKFADGKGFAANINPETPVLTQGVDKPGTLADLKKDQNVTIKVDGADNAIQILISKE
jgi:hypothetical protein